MEPEQICQMAGQTIVNKIFLVTAGKTKIPRLKLIIFNYQAADGENHQHMGYYHSPGLKPSACSCELA